MPKEVRPIARAKTTRVFWRNRPGVRLHPAERYRPEGANRTVACCDASREEGAIKEVRIGEKGGKPRFTKVDH